MNRREPAVIPSHLVIRIATQNNEDRTKRPILARINLERRRRYLVYSAMVLVAGLAAALLVAAQIP